MNPLILELYLILSHIKTCRPLCRLQLPLLHAPINQVNKSALQLTLFHVSRNKGNWMWTSLITHSLLIHLSSITYCHSHFWLCCLTIAHLLSLIVIHISHFVVSQWLTYLMCWAFAPINYMSYLITTSTQVSSKTNHLWYFFGHHHFSNISTKFKWLAKLPIFNLIARSKLYQPSDLSIRFNQTIKVLQITQMICVISSKTQRMKILITQTNTQASKAQYFPRRSQAVSSGKVKQRSSVPKI